MKWFAKLAVFTMAVPLSVSAPVPVSAQALPSSGLVEECAAIRFPGRTLGECVSTQTVRSFGAPGTAPLQCEFFQDLFPDFFDATWGSFEECIQDISEDLRPN